MRGYLPPIRGYLPPIKRISSPIRGYLPPIRGYLPPIRGYLPPIRGYLPPMRGYLPPMRGYLPPMRAWRGDLSDLKLQVASQKGFHCICVFTSLVSLIFVWLCFTSHRQQGHLSHWYVACSHQTLAMTASAMLSLILVPCNGLFTQF